MPIAYRQVDLQKMEWCSKDTIHKHIDRFIPIYFSRGGKMVKRYLSREDSLIYKAWLEATKSQRIKAFCEIAFEQEFTGEVPAMPLVILAHYNDGWRFDKIFFHGEEIEKVNQITWLQSLLNKLRIQCYPPFERNKRYMQVFEDYELDLFGVRKWKKRGYRAGSRIIIDGFGRRFR